MNIALSPITAVKPHEYCCPHCASPIFFVLSCTSTVLEGDYWLHDGDNLEHAGMCQLLIKAGLERKDYFNDTPHHDVELLVGECPYCEKEYWVISATFIDDSAAIDEAFVDAYCYKNAETVSPSNYRAFDGKDSWAVSEYVTDCGVVHHHQFGPFIGEDDDGVSCARNSPIWSFGEAFMIERWAALKALATQRDGTEARCLTP